MGNSNCRSRGKGIVAEHGPTEEGKTYLPIATLDKVRDMLSQNMGATEIARACGVSTTTVYRVKAKLDQSMQDSAQVS